MASNTLKALSLNSRGYAARRTYGFGYTARRTYGFDATAVEMTVKPSPINSRGYADRHTYGFGPVPTIGMTVKPSPINSRGYAARRTYGNRTTVQGMHADGVPQHRRWATPSGSISLMTHSLSVGSANPRLLNGDRVAVIRQSNGDRVAVIEHEKDFWMISVALRKRADGTTFVQGTRWKKID